MLTLAIAYLCVAVSLGGMLAGLIRPPNRNAGFWLAVAYLVGAVAFILVDRGLPIALFTALGTWLGTLLTARRGNRSHFRAGAIGWFVGLGVGIWWALRINS